MSCVLPCFPGMSGLARAETLRKLAFIPGFLRWRLLYWKASACAAGTSVLLPFHPVTRPLGHRCGTSSERVSCGVRCTGSVACAACVASTCESQWSSEGKPLFFHLGLFCFFILQKDLEFLTRVVWPECGCSRGCTCDGVNEGRRKGENCPRFRPGGVPDGK